MLEDVNEKCAVVGIYGNKEASKLAYFSLHALQHRGQEAAGISSSDGKKLHTIKKRGLVMRVFDEKKLETLSGSSAIGHTRYSTAGDDSILDAQPVFARYDLGEMAIVHNGNLTNAEEIRNKLIDKGAIFQTFMDTENLIHLIAKSEQRKLLDRIIDAVQRIEGAFSLVFLSRTKMFAMRDRHGFRPLSLGKLPNGGYIVASETCAFDLVGAEFIRDVEPGELLIFDENKEPESIKVFEPTPKHCIFEYVYFARPDSKVFGQSVYQTRKNMGIELARIKPVEADMVIPVPDGGVPAAIGYAQESGIPYEMGIMRNHYIGRTFIEPTQEMRDLKVKMKLSPMIDIIKGKRVIVVDDSIVRGTTSKRIVRMLKEAGASEVHMRVSSPPTTDPCFYGVDTPNKDKLIAANMSQDDICKFIEADSLAYLDEASLLRSVNTKEENYCTACFTGKYIV
ncbi:MAG: amidophosphoribosyltransferase [Sulfurimonas sp. RIFOXYD12_FULL_33_39]|uniref:amidophosphoribosyltransferase n=1 Tax=unclassified Sulfurimonas TaxID=2623549 RepID=UPI0008C9B8E1|nr:MULTISPECIES: amidophosphoribosyltransferase [unclassified Sulfurimonas]OHE09749.1 MAG: amidophosphoribosyltransferase [Sulfurimonas sp. RIFOXYD12_FULL_33_39]OHE13743.1 MAG: amidophosphoribosyltransferase [Sulfurimonas sp. RIFOXYD2_FULL_34_21]DAB27938.1 MAG TPA: amidophosphoribosyltransferase [Sulfurimonas sp. UBA10385]